MWPPDQPADAAQFAQQAETLAQQQEAQGTQRLQAAQEFKNRVDEASILMRQFVQSAVDVKAEAQRLGAAAGISDQHVAMLEAGCVKAAQAEQALAGVKEIAQAMVAEAEEKQAAGKKEEK